MADRLAGGKLTAALARLRGKDGLSFAAIAARLYADHGIEVTAPTVRSWCLSLDIKAPEKAEAS